VADSLKLALIAERGAPHLDIYLDCMATASGIREVAVADSSGAVFEHAQARLAGRFGSIPVYADYHALLQERQPDLAIISFPADDAPVAIEAALKANCHVLSEKPACVRSADFERLSALAHEQNRNLVLAFATRVNPLVIKARDLVRGGTLGKLYGASMYFLADQTRLRSSQYHQSWAASKDRSGGGHLIWLGIHYVDVVQFICGQQVVKVCGFTANVGGQPLDVEDSAAVSMAFEGGMLGTLQSGYYLDRDYQSLIQIWGSEGWLRMDLVSGAPLEWHSNGASGIETFAAPADILMNLYPLFVQEVIDSVRHGSPPPVAASEALQTLKVVFGLYQAASGGLTQQIP
jgi:predicted dehydrogenase